MAKACYFLDNIKDTVSGYNFGFLHIKAVDDAAHDRDADLRVALLERVDRMLDYLAKEIEILANIQERKFLIVLTGDHTTPVALGDHSCDPVPFVIHGVGFDLGADNVKEFDELSCSLGSLGRFRGSEVMPLLKTISSSF